MPSIGNALVAFNIIKANASILLIAVTMICIQSTAKAANLMLNEKGAKIYCFMRKKGNTYEASWKAASSYIQRNQGISLKKSNKNVNDLIAESVIEKPIDFPGCGIYLSDLYNSNIKTNSPILRNQEFKKMTMKKIHDSSYVESRYHY